MRVLHAPCNVGNQPWTLSRAERALGLKSDLICNYSTWLGYPADRVLGSVGGRGNSELWQRRLHGYAAAFRYDVLHYYFGRSLLYWDDLPDLNTNPFADLKIARALGRKIIMTLQGCDARLAEESNRRNQFTPCHPDRCGAYSICLAQLDAQRRAMIHDILPLCDRVFYLNPELGHYVPNAEFLPYANVDIDAFTFSPLSDRVRPTIVHAPSDPKIKGTAMILEALERLRSKHDFDLVLVERKSHSEAMEIYKSADLVIDQILAGWYGGLAVEVMAMGKPVACYIRAEDKGFVPPQMLRDMPLVNIRPDALVDDLDSLLTRRAEWAELGRRGRAYVERWHSPHRIAVALQRIYRDVKAPFAIESDA
jgi:hypothetical protein